MESVGVALEEFLLAYEKHDVTAMALHIRRLEDEASNTNIPSAATVIEEILSDCIKKSSAVVRQQYAERINTLCSSCRKQLKAKVAKDAESSTTHSTRHVASLLELMGCWSNIIAEMAEMCLSCIPLLRACVTPYHDRIVVVAMECFATLSDAKSLPAYLSRVTSAESAAVNIVSLDQLISQVHSQLAIMWRYNAYLTSLQLPLAFLSQWKLVELQYISLEQAYLRHATQQALCDSPTLIEIEPDISVLQGAEDVMVIVMYVYERIAASPEHVVFVLMNNVIETLGQNSDVFNRLTDSAVILPVIFDVLYPIVDDTNVRVNGELEASEAAPLLFSFAATVAENITTWTNASPPASNNSAKDEVVTSHDAPREVDSVTLLVYYNTLMVLQSSLTKLRMRFSNDSAAIAPHHAAMLLQELSGLERHYEMFVTNEVSTHLSPLIEAITNTLADVLKREYVLECDKIHETEALSNIGIDMMKQLSAIRNHASFDLSKLVIAF